MDILRSIALSHPERIHPALWRGSQLALARTHTVPTGFGQLDQELPGQGWPLSTLIELILGPAGIGEMNLLHPALAQLDPERSIALVHPPYTPYFHCWANWRLDAHRLLWINTQTLGDTLWAAEQTLKHNACAALLCWVPGVRSAALHRLHLIARQSDTLFILLRPQTAAQQPSTAPLRLSLRPISEGLEISIIKRRGPRCNSPVAIPLYPAHAPITAPATHASLDQPLPAHAQPGRPFSLLAH
jgi:protein ImuA